MAPPSIRRRQGWPWERLHTFSPADSRRPTLHHRFKCILLVIVGALLVDGLLTGIALPRYGYYPIRGRWLRWPTLRDWRAVERWKASMRKAQPLDASAPPPLWVLSIPTSTERRLNMTKAWVGADLTFVDALSGKQQLPADLTRQYTSRVRAAHAAAGDAFQRSKIAIDLSHLRLAHRLVAAGLEAVVVLEDDVAPAASKGARRLVGVGGWVGGVAGGW